MEALRVLELAYVVEAVLVWHVEPHAPVEAYDEKAHVVAQAGASAQRHFLKGVFHLELPSCAIVVFHLPHVAGIEEERAIEVAEEAWAVFKVGQELYVACLVEVIDACRGRVVVRARAYRPHREGAYGVGTTHVELFGVRRVLRVAVAPNDTRVDVSHEGGVGREPPRLHQFCLNLEELCVWVVEHLLVLVAPFLSRGEIAERQDVSRLRHRGLPPQGILQLAGRRVGVDILHARYELVAHGVIEIWVGVEHGVELRRRAPHVVVREVEGRELVSALGGCL